MPTSPRHAAAFTLLIDRRANPWRWLAAPLLAAAVLLAPRMAAAQPLAAPVWAKLARDLHGELGPQRSSPSRERWVREERGMREVELIVLGQPGDPDQQALRQEVQRLGGQVMVRHGFIRGVTVRLPAAKMAALAQHPQVASVSPNRSTQRTASTLEAITGTLHKEVRQYSSKTVYAGLDGSGVGVAVLDSGVMAAHRGFNDNFLFSRIKRSVSMLRSSAALFSSNSNGTLTSLAPGSLEQALYETQVNTDSLLTQDPYGHGTHVASVIAGRGYAFSGVPDVTGLAPNAHLYDVQVLNAQGTGTVSDTLEGMAWVVYHAREFNIRVINLSLAAASGESWRTDPLCVAARTATAAGITVVAAAGNFGLNMQLKQVYGAISSPANDPSVITVGAVNYRGTNARTDDLVTLFSSRGPTRGGWVDAAGVRHPDNLLKPDLVAPGNRIAGAAATQASLLFPTWNALASTHWALLVAPLSTSQQYGQTVMMMSGTSIAAPTVAGAVALLLQANPGLTPPMVKAILQYTAQPLAGANLLQQGAGQLNVLGAVALARTLRTDVASGLAAGTLAAGTPLNTKSLPPRSSTVAGTSFNWSRIVFAGGSQVLSGDALFTKLQPFYDPRLTWANGQVLRRVVSYWPGTMLVPGNTFPHSVVETPLTQGSLVTAGVVSGTALAGVSSQVGQTGAFIPTATLAGWLGSGSGTVLGSGVVLAQGLVLSEGFVISEGLVLSEGFVISEGFILSEGFVISEGVVRSESGGNPAPGYFTTGALYGER